jgi:exosortase/archaeosortase
VYKPYFFDKNLSSKIGVRLSHGILFFFFLEKLDPLKKAIIQKTTKTTTLVLSHAFVLATDKAAIRF